MFVLVVYVAKAGPQIPAHRLYTTSARPFEASAKDNLSSGRLPILFNHRSFRETGRSRGSMA